MALTEPTFTLKARDYSAPRIVEEWALLRLRAIVTGHAPRSDVGQVVEALTVALEMRQWRAVARGEALDLETGARVDCVALLARHFPVALAGAGGVEAMI